MKQVASFLPTHLHVYAKPIQIRALRPSVGVSNFVSALTYIMQIVTGQM
jgi:hypothetical protein